MGNYPSNVRALFGIAVIAIAGILSSNARQLVRPSGYLVKTGPSPLRFQPPRSPMNLPPLTMTDGPVSAGNSAKTNPAPESNIPLVLPMSPLAGLLYDPATNASFPAETNSPGNIPPAANDLLIVTPQMLADYFKSVPGATNAAHVNMFGPVYFMPPTAPPPSSSATYRIE